MLHVLNRDYPDIGIDRIKIKDNYVSRNLSLRGVRPTAEDVAIPS